MDKPIFDLDAELLRNQFAVGSGENWFRASDL